MPKTPPNGIPVIAIPLDRLIEAAQAVAAMATQEVSKLKINSGEHLAAILITAFLGRAPVGIEPYGGPDLVFSRSGEEPAVAVEIKSLEGPFRHKVAKATDRPAPIEIRLTSLNRVVQDYCLPQIARAAAQLNTKVPETDFPVSKQVFLVSHPIDHLAIESLDNIMVSHTLDPLPAQGEIDAVWLLLPPDQLVVWNVAQQRWISVLCGVQHESDPRDPTDVIEDYDPEITLLQNIEAMLLRSIEFEGVSPYQLTIDIESAPQAP